MKKRLLLLVCTGCVALQAIAQKPEYQDIQKSLQTQMIMAEAGDTIRIGEGYFSATGTLSMDDKKDVVIQGAGMGKTILSFKGQTEGAEGLHFSHCQNITLADLTGTGVQDTAIATLAWERAEAGGAGTALEN